MSSQSKLHIATLGRASGLFGEMKLHLFTDFYEQFDSGAKFQSSRGQLVIDYVDLDLMRIKLKGIDTREDTRVFTNVKLYSTKEDTREVCNLGEDEYFWFDVIGCKVYENDICLGEIKDIDRLAVSDYLYIDTDNALVSEGSTKTFLLPYIDRFIENVDIDNKRIEVTGARDILEAS